MGADTRLETSAHRRSFRTVREGSHVPYIRRGWLAHGHYFRNFLRPLPRAHIAAMVYRSHIDSLALVLCCAHGLAGVGHSRRSNAYCHHRRMGLKAAERHLKFALCCRAHHSRLATAATFPGRFPTLLFRRALPRIDDSAIASVGRAVVRT